jgi:DNA-binding NtrC family response regulator
MMHNILLIEDDEQIRRMYTQAFEAQGFSCDAQEDGNVALEGVSVEGLAIATNDGNVELVDVVNNGHASIQTFDGNVRIRGTSVGVITTKIKGDGRLWDERNTKPSGPGALEIVTKDGNVTLRK